MILQKCGTFAKMYALFLMHYIAVTSSGIFPPRAFIMGVYRYTYMIIFRSYRLVVTCNIETLQSN